MTSAGIRPVVVLTPNPAIDITYTLPTLVPGDTNRIRAVARLPGGKGLNVARVLAQLGRSTVSVLPLGGEAGAWIARDLTALELEYDAVSIAGATRSTVTVVSDAAHPTVLTEPGPTLTAPELERLTDALRARLSNAAALVISGSLPAGVDPGVLGDWVRLGRAAGVPCVVDASGPALVAAARAGADVVKPNRHEALDTTGEASVEAALARLHGWGARTVLVSLGAAGILASETAGAPLMRRAALDLGDEAVNPTGAGDAATAGLVDALVAGAPLFAALDRANAVGAAAALMPLAGEIDLARLPSLALLALLASARVSDSERL